jgi:hypothetical protein
MKQRRRWNWKTSSCGYTESVTRASTNGQRQAQELHLELSKRGIVVENIAMTNSSKLGWKSKAALKIG